MERLQLLFSMFPLHISLSLIELMILMALPPTPSLPLNFPDASVQTKKFIFSELII